MIPCLLIDSTALRSSLYDSQAKWGKSTRYGWYKGYKAHVCSTPEGVVLSYAFTTANVHDSKMAPVLLQDIKDRNVLFPLQMLLMIVNISMKARKYITSLP